MALDFYFGSGSPYAWRVWLALEHKAIPYTFKLMSFDAGDTEKPEFKKINPRQKVPTIVDDGFALYESSAIVEYLEDKKPGAPSLFSADIRERAIQRRLIREADDYFFAPLRTIFAAITEKKPPENRRRRRESARATRTLDVPADRRVPDRRVVGGRLHALSIRGAGRALRSAQSTGATCGSAAAAAQGMGGPPAEASHRAENPSPALEIGAQNVATAMTHPA
jgi:glutathione S-transferase